MISHIELQMEFRGWETNLTISNVNVLEKLEIEFSFDIKKLAF